jgi:hypothetical protein
MTTSTAEDSVAAKEEVGRIAIADPNPCRKFGAVSSNLLQEGFAIDVLMALLKSTWRIHLELSGVLVLSKRLVMAWMMASLPPLSPHLVEAEKGRTNTPPWLVNLAPEKNLQLATLLLLKSPWSSMTLNHKIPCHLRAH